MSSLINSAIIIQVIFWDAALPGHLDFLPGPARRRNKQTKRTTLSMTAGSHVDPSPANHPQRSIPSKKQFIFSSFWPHHLGTGAAQPLYMTQQSIARFVHDQKHRLPAKLTLSLVPAGKIVGRHYKEILWGYCFPHFADVNNTLFTVSSPVTVKVAKQTWNKSEFSPPNSALKRQIITLRLHDSLVSPLHSSSQSIEGAGRGEDGVFRLPDGASRTLILWWQRSVHLTPLRQSLPDLEFHRLQLFISQVNSVCPLEPRTESLRSQVNHFELVGYIFAREDSKAVAA